MILEFLEILEDELQFPVQILTSWFRNLHYNVKIVRSWEFKF